MLFDLRGRGRRRTVQVIYVTLAVLMGGGLVFFGIGGSVSGGLFDAVGLTNGNSGGGTSSQDLLVKQERRAEARTRTTPRDAAAWAALARTRYQLAGQGENYDQQTGTFKAGGRQQLARAGEAWDRYVALNPPKPDAGLATLMLQAFGPLGLNQPAQGVGAAEIVAEQRPSAQAYYQLAVFAFAAKQNRKAELAGRKAIELAPAAERAQVKALIDQARKQGGFPPVTAAPTQGSGGTPSDANQPKPKLPPGARAERRGPRSDPLPPTPVAAGGPGAPLTWPAAPGPLAQLVEQEPLNLKVEGSSPSRPIDAERLATARTLFLPPSAGRSTQS